MQNLNHTIYIENDNLFINYPLAYTEEQVQKLINDLKNHFYNIDSNAFELKRFKRIQLDTQDIAISLLFFFKELISSEQFKELNTEIYFQPKVYDLIIKNFGENELFNTEQIKKVNKYE